MALAAAKDHYRDMDFKVAGTPATGITALTPGCLGHGLTRSSVRKFPISVG